MLHQKFFFNIIKSFLLVLILLLTFTIAYFIVFPHEAFAMDPYDDNINDDRVNWLMSVYHNYMAIYGERTIDTRPDWLRETYPRGIPVDYSIINDPYDNEKYFDIPLTMIWGESKNIDLSSGIYSGCISTDIDGLLIWPERHHFHTEFVKDYTQVLTKNSNITSISLGARTIYNRVVFVYIKCQDINKRKYHWTIWERNERLKKWSYKTFKIRWDNETNIWSNIDEKIRNDIIIEIKDLLDVKTVDEKLRKSVRSEVEKLIRETKPFSNSRS